MKVTNLENKKYIYVRINDRGPFVNDRIIDLSKQAAIELNFYSKGVEKVNVQLIESGPHLLDKQFINQKYMEKYAKKIEYNGAGEILLTSMDKDGTKSGYDVDLLKAITKNTNIPVIASGGVGKLDHLYDGIVKGGASAVLAASIFHYGEFTIKDTKEYLKSKNIPVRL